MTTPSRINEIIEEMNQNPTLADALRQRILGQQFAEALQSMLISNTEMMTRQAQLGETVRDAMNAVADNVQQMVSLAQRMSSDIERIEDRADLTELQVQQGQRSTQEQLNDLRGAVDNAAGLGYEMKVTNNLRSLLRQHLRLRNARILKGPSREPDEELTEALDQARDKGLITEEELGAVLLLDVIARANTTDRQTVYAAVEISITVNDHDIIRAQERAQTISKATGAPAEAVVIGDRANERAAAMMADGKAQMVGYPAG
jgi:hypothetical protein